MRVTTSIQCGSCEGAGSACVSPSGSSNDPRGYGRACRHCSGLGRIEVSAEVHTSADGLEVEVGQVECREWLTREETSRAGEALAEEFERQEKLEAA